MTQRRTLSALAVLSAAALAGCGSSSSSGSAGATGPASTAGSSTSGGSVAGTIVVDAAASLTGTFTTLAQQFEKAHPGSTVKLNFGGSDTLAAAITAGAPVDVFAAASLKTMQTVTNKDDGIGSPQTFATNELEIAVPPSNPQHIASLADTARSGVTLVLCAASVPCGAAATQAYAAATLTPHPASLEQDVKSVLTKVELDEADAGVVYQTDVKAAGSKVKGVQFTEAAKAIATYPIVTVKGGKNPTGGSAFEQYVLSTAGTAVLSAAGFQGP
jgi:molybdate transport system substrate-binding protein